MNQVEFANAAKNVNNLLLTHALKFTRDEEDAKDLVQETLIKGIRFCAQFNAQTNLRSWLYVIMRNTFINNYRKAKKRQELFAQDQELCMEKNNANSTLNEAVSTFVLSDIEKAMASLTPMYRIPFQRYFEGYRYEEISQQLQIPLGTVKTHIHEARIQLKKYLNSTYRHYARN